MYCTLGLRIEQLFDTSSLSKKENYSNTLTLDSESPWPLRSASKLLVLLGSGQLFLSQSSLLFTSHSLLLLRLCLQSAVAAGEAVGAATKLLLFDIFLSGNNSM